MRTNPWLEKSKLNLIPLSLADEFVEALKEWAFTGEVQDYGDASEDCELCEHSELRYHFEIKNEIKKILYGLALVAYYAFKKLVFLMKMEIVLLISHRVVKN